MSNALKPELYVTNFQKSLDFYTKILGFTVEYTRENPKFAFLSYEDSQIMIQEASPFQKDEYVTGDLFYPLGRGINLQIDTHNIEQINNMLNVNNYPIRRKMIDSWYRVKDVVKGRRELLVQDPDGYLLRFSQSIGEKPVE